MDSSKHYDLRVVMFPWLAHGHISPFLELAKKLAKTNLYIYLCSTPVILSSIYKQQIICCSSIELVELHLPSLPDLPPHYHTTKSLPLHLQNTLRTAFDLAKPAFSDILSTLRPDLLIYDFIQPWAPEVASQLNIPAVHFQTMGAAATSYLIHKFNSPTSETEFPFSDIYYFEHEYNKMSKLLASCSNGVSGRERFIQCIRRSANIILIKTYGEIEAKYIQYLSSMIGKEIIPVGLLVQEPKNEITSKFSEWLNKKDKLPTVFVSFGSEYFMSREEILEVAHGLELSGVNFIWVVRFPEGEETNVDEVLPHGFLERTGERGMVVERWAPQMAILAHPSIGGFVTHCGWSSVQEAMMLGVPIIAMPMHLDQPLNARLMVELGVALEIQRDSKNGNAIHTRGEIARVIKQVMAIQEGNAIRKRMKDMSESLAKTGDGEVDVVVRKLLELCNKKKVGKKPGPDQFFRLSSKALDF